MKTYYVPVQSLCDVERNLNAAGVEFATVREARAEMMRRGGFGVIVKAETDGGAVLSIVDYTTPRAQKHN